jgi:hypothetical protein
MEEHNVFPPVVSKERLNKEGYSEEVVHKVMHHSERIDRKFFLL